jgi:hypothetical protein
MIRITLSPLVSSSCTLLAGGLAARLRPAAQEHWFANNSMGDYSNLLLCGEFEDPDMIRVGADHCLLGITTQINPAGDFAIQGSGEFKLSEHGLRDAGRSVLVC